MKPFLLLLIILKFGISAYALETVIGGQRYLCEPVDSPREEWFCSIDLSIHRGGVHTGSGSTRNQAATEAKSSCISSEDSVMRNLCGMPPQCEPVSH